MAGLEMLVKAGSMTRADGTRPSPADPAIVIYGSQSRLYRSTDGLATSVVVEEALQQPGQPRQPPFADIVFAPSVPTVVYAATEGYMVFKSTDAGATWQFLGNLRQDVLNVVP